MKVKSILKIVIFFIVFCIIIFILLIFTLLKNSETSHKKAEHANDIVLKIFERRILSEEYIDSKLDRPKIQWISKQEEIENMMTIYEGDFTTPSEIEQVDRIKIGLTSSKNTFHELVNLYEATPFASRSSALSEKENRIAVQLRLKAQETISAATNLASINNINIEKSMRLIFLIFSVSTSMFLVLLTVSFWIIWRGAAKLDEANNKLQSLDKLKDDFLSIASHELRTPMTAIKGLVSMIQDGDYGPVGDKLKEPLHDIGISTERLIRLVNDLLNVTRIQAGRLKISLSNFDIASVVKEITNSLNPIAIQNNISLVAEADNTSSVQGDSDKVKQILNNLIGNALKFTKEGSIKIWMKDDVELAKIFVEDSGIGISTEDTKKLFGKFQQISEGLVGRPAGTGLGLYISRELARKMGGDLWLEKSTPNVGSVFAFSIPKAGTKKASEAERAVKEESDKHPDQK